MIRQIVFLTSLCLTLSVSERAASAADPQGYLALGDSLAFGYTPLATQGDLSQYHGYPEIVAAAIHRKLENASCFGESAQHFLDISKPDLGCQAWRDAHLKLFVGYGIQQTQMDYAVHHLKNGKTDLVTIDIGINDLGVLLFVQCQGDPACALPLLPGLLSTYYAELSTIYSRIRFEAGYKGPIVAVNAYAFNYLDPVQTPAIALLNSTLSAVTTTFGGKIADAFTAFGAAAAPSGNVCDTGLLVKLTATTCDTHPSPAGQALIASLVKAQIP